MHRRIHKWVTGPRPTTGRDRPGDRTVALRELSDH